MSNLVLEFRKATSRGGEFVRYEVQCRKAAPSDLKSNTKAAPEGASAFAWREAAEEDLKSIKVEDL